MRQSVGSTPCLLGKAVDCTYIRDPSYLEVIILNLITAIKFIQHSQLNCSFLYPLQIDVDIGSSTVANGVLGLVIGVITSLVVDMAFLVQVRSFFLSRLII